MNRLFIFAVLILGCSEEHEPQKKRCSYFIMTISDAIPVQFWVNGVETYNQKEVCGITPACFCLPFECDDEIRIQVNDSQFSTLSLTIIDSSGTEITSIAFSETSNNIYDISFIPSELGICDEQIRLMIVGNDTLSNEEFTSNLNSWEEFSTGDDWSWASDAGNGSAVGNTLTSSTTYLRQSIAIKAPSEGGVSLSVDLEYNAAEVSPGTTELKIYGFLSGVVTELASFTIISGVNTINDQILALGTYDYLGFRLIKGAGEHIVNVHYFRLTYEENGMNSDCIDIKTSHDCTQLIRYDNAKDFAGIEYSSFSPTAEFYIRIPAIFFHERNTEEEENFEESSENMVRLRNEIKLKRLLEVGFMPDYMHRKLLLILAHDTIEIDGESWIKRDPYEKEEPTNKRYPLKKATVLLTQKDYIKRNIL